MQAAATAYFPPPLGGASSENQYGFPIEGDDVLLSTLNKVGISDVKESDLQRPTQQIAMMCFSAFLELLSFVNDAVIDSLKSDCLQQLEHKELYDDSLQVIIRFREIRALMIASCVADFTLSDITRPKAKRFKRQMFALINFYRFSEHHIGMFDRLKEENDQVFRERDEMSLKLQDVEARLEHEEDVRESQKAQTMEMRDLNAKLSEKLRQLKEEQSTLLNELEDVKHDRNSVQAKLLRLVEESRLLQDEIEKLKMRIENTPKELRAMIDKQKRQLKDKRAQFAEEDSKAQGMHEKKKVLDALEVDIAECTTLVKSCLEEQAELMREKQELERVHQHAQDMTKERDNLAMQLEQLREKLKFAMERLERTQKTIEQKRQENARRVESESEEWKVMQQEKARRAGEVEKCARQLAELELEYERITQSFDEFYGQLLAQKQQLEQQCSAYMKAISSQMDLQVDL